MDPMSETLQGYSIAQPRSADTHRAGVIPQRIDRGDRALAEGHGHLWLPRLAKCIAQRMSVNRERMSDAAVIGREHPQDSLALLERGGARPLAPHRSPATRGRVSEEVQLSDGRSGARDVEPRRLPVFTHHVAIILVSIAAEDDHLAVDPLIGPRQRLAQAHAFLGSSPTFLKLIS